MEKVCRELAFFWELELSKSQAETLLNRLAREWEPGFDALCELLAVSTVVHADETSWGINSVWALLSDSVQILLFGVPRDAATLETLLPKGLFAGVLVSDDAAVYRDFSLAQKCSRAPDPQGDQADVAGTGERGVPPVPGRAAGCLPPGLPFSAG